MECKKCKKDVSQKVCDFSKENYGKILCFECQKKEKLKDESSESTPTEQGKSKKVIQIKGKDFVTYAGLLDQAQGKGLKSFEILEQWVSEDMTRAWCKVRAYFQKDDKLTEVFFDGIGSATPENTTDIAKHHPIEMSHTRAKGRALRDFLNIGEAMLEELKKDDDKDDKSPTVEDTGDY